MLKYNNLSKLVISIIICELAGFIGSAFTVSQINTWYASLNKPSFNPPNWIFGPVWTAIFVLMGIALYLVWIKKWETKNEIYHRKIKAWNPFSRKFLGAWQKANVILVFATQLVLNVLWSILFFGLHSPGVAFFELLMLWFAIIFLIINFYKVSKVAAWLLLPYILWVSFAAILNLAIFLIN